MEDIEKKKLYNSDGINQSIDLSEFNDGEIKPMETDYLEEIETKKKLKKQKIENKEKQKSKKNKSKAANFVSFLENFIEQIQHNFAKLKNSKNPEMIIAFNIIIGVFFFMLSEPALLHDQNTYKYIEEITSALKTSLFMILLSSLFFAISYLFIFYIRKEINKYLSILPLIIQFAAFMSCDNELNSKLNFGIYRKFVLFMATLGFFLLGFFIKINHNFLQRKNNKIKITTFIFYFTLVIYLNILIRGVCEKKKLLLDENLIDNAIGCNTEDYEYKYCMYKIFDDYFEMENFFPLDSLELKNQEIDRIFINKRKFYLSQSMPTLSQISSTDQNKHQDDSQKEDTLSNNKSRANDSKISESQISEKKKQDEQLQPVNTNFLEKKIYLFPDLKNLFFDKLLRKELERYQISVNSNKNTNETIKANSDKNYIKNLLENIYNISYEEIPLSVRNEINAKKFIKFFLNNIITIDTGIQIEISLDNNNNNSKPEKRERNNLLSSGNFNTNNDQNTNHEQNKKGFSLNMQSLEVKNPINANSNLEIKNDQNSHNINNIHNNLKSEFSGIIQTNQKGNDSALFNATGQEDRNKTEILEIRHSDKNRSLFNSNFKDDNSTYNNIDSKNLNLKNSVKNSSTNNNSLGISYNHSNVYNNNNKTANEQLIFNHNDTKVTDNRVSKDTISKTMAEPENSLKNQEILYDNRDAFKPFININPQISESTIARLKLSSKLPPQANTIILINFENLHRLKFKIKFPFVYGFLKKFSKTNQNPLIKLSEELNEAEIKKLREKDLAAKAQSYQLLKFFPNSTRLNLEKNFTLYKNMLRNISENGYISMLGASDLITQDSSDGKNASFISKNLFNILSTYDKVILQKFYSRFETLLLNKKENENKIFSDKNLILEYSSKFISEFPEKNKLVHLIFEENMYSNDLDKEIYLWLKNVKKILNNKKYFFVFYSNIAENKPFYVSRFSDVYIDDVERNSMMFFILFPNENFDNKILEIVKLNENNPSCECDLSYLVSQIASGKKSEVNDNYKANKDKLNSKIFFLFIFLFLIFRCQFKR